MSAKYYLGKEAEGKYKRHTTLFVQHFNKCDPHEIFNLAYKHKVKQIYIGSKGTAIKDYEKFKFLAQLLRTSNKMLTCRVEKFEIPFIPFLENVHYVFSFDKTFDVAIRQNDVSNKQIIVSEASQRNTKVTRHNDKLYEQDKPL